MVENLSLWDYFAGQALIALLGRRSDGTYAVSIPLNASGAEGAARQAYTMADAMLKVRNELAEAKKLGANGSLQVFGFTP